MYSSRTVGTVVVDDAEHQIGERSVRYKCITVTDWRYATTANIVEPSMFLESRQSPLIGEADRLAEAVITGQVGNAKLLRLLAAGNTGHPASSRKRSPG